MEGGWGRENREEDKGTKERKRNGKEEGCICEMEIKNGKGKGEKGFKNQRNARRREKSRKGEKSKGNKRNCKQKDCAELKN